MRSVRGLLVMGIALLAMGAMIAGADDVEPPAAEAGEDIQGLVNVQVTFDGSASTDNVGIVRYAWEFKVDNSDVRLEGMVVSYVFSTGGNYTVTLTVFDAMDFQGSDTLVVTVLVEDDELPVARAGDDRTVDQGATVTLDGSASTDNVGIAAHRWTLVEGGETVTLAGALVEHTFDLAGAYTVTLNVTDTFGNGAEDTVVVTVRDTEPPVADAGPDMTVVVTETVTFNASGSTDNVGIESFVWTFDHSGTPQRLEDLATAFAFLVPGDYEVTLTVTDVRGYAATDTLVVHVLTGERAWVLGPFDTRAGEPVAGVPVRVELNGTTYYGYTDAEGSIELMVHSDDLVTSAKVTADKKGWRTLRFDVPLDGKGDPDGEIPPMERVRVKGSSLTVWIIVLVVVLVMIGIGLTVVRSVEKE